MENVLTTQENLRDLREHHHAFRGTVFLVVLLGFLALVRSARADISLVNNPMAITGPLQVRLAFTDTDGIQQDYRLQNAPQVVLNALPGGLQQQQNSGLLQSQGTPNGYFDQLWSRIRDGVCGDVAGEVVKDIHDSQNAAYDVSCNTNMHGVLQARIENSWFDPNWGQTKTGTRLVLDYWIPFNSVNFTVTSPYTCKAGNFNLVCPSDNQFTAIFEVHIIVRSTSSDPSSLELLPIDSHTGTVTVVNVVAGDSTQAIISAAVQFYISLSTTTEFGEAGFLVSVAQLLAQVGGIAVAGIGNGHLRDTVSSDLSLLSSFTAGSGALTASQDFDSLYSGLLSGASAGFTQFGVSAGLVFGANGPVPDGSLIFRLTYPPVAKPALHNIADSNNPPSLFPPSIGVSPRQVGLGGHLTVNGNYFNPAYTHHLIINWDHPVRGQATTEVDWGPRGGRIQHATTTQDSFEADNLTPGTFYQFRVHECDPISCAPWSDWLTIETQSLGSDQVMFWLDNDPAHSIGSATVGAGGTFSANVTIPLNETLGQHTIHAAVTGEQSNTVAPIDPAPTQQASTTFTVCGASGCAPSIAVVNASGQVQGSVEVGYPFTLHGDGFGPGTVIVYVDSPNGLVVGTAQIVGSITTGCPTCSGGWSFQTSFIMPFVSGGYHNLVAAEKVNGQTLQATVKVYVNYRPQ